jgi:hypothetical protein
MRAYTVSPSRARKVTTSGRIHGPRRNSSVRDSVTCTGCAPGPAALRYSSGGRSAVECRSASRVPSGESVASVQPSSPVTRVRAPPSAGTVYTARSPGWVSLVVIQKVRRSGASATSVTSHAPEVSAVARPPEAGAVYRCACPLRSETKYTRSSESQPAV